MAGGTVLEGQPAPARQAPAPPAPNGRPTRGRIGPPAQSPLLVPQDELKSRRRLEPRHGGRIELEPQHWVLLAMVILVLVVIITVAVLVSKAFH